MNVRALVFLLMSLPALFESQAFADSYFDPALYAYTFLNVTPHPWQFEDAARTTEELRAGNPHIESIFLKAHGTGGTMWMAAKAHWFATTRRNSRTLTTAPSWFGVRDLFWSEFRQLHENSVFGKLKFGKLNETGLEYAPKWDVTGRASDQDVKMEGYHSLDGVCICFDEAKGIRDSLFASLTGALVSKQTLRIYSSTPGFEHGRFYKLWQERNRPGRIAIHIHGKRALAEGLPGMEILERELRENWGADSEEYSARWLARFMRGRRGGLISSADVVAALLRPAGMIGRKHAALDVARSTNGNWTVLGLLIGNDLIRVHRWRQRDTDRIENEILPILREFGATRLRVDAPGLGGPIVDGLRAKAEKSDPNLAIEEYWEGGRACDPTIYANRHSEAVCLAARRLREGGVSICRTDVDGEELELDAQLLQYERHPTDDHRYHVEKQPKDAAGKTPPSPDIADMYVIGTAPDQVSEAEEWLKGRAIRDAELAEGVKAGRVRLMTRESVRRRR